VEVSREVVKNLADHMLPLMKKLQPMVQKIAAAVGESLNKSIDEMGVFLKGFMPTLDKISDIIVGLVGIFTDLQEVMQAGMRFVSEVVMGFFKNATGEGGSMKSLMIDVRKTIREVLGQIILFAAKLMNSFGWTQGLDALMRGLKGGGREADKENATGFAAAMNASFKSVGDMSKNVQLEAFRASAMSVKDDPAAKSADFLGEIRTQLAEIKASGTQAEGEWGKRISDAVAMVGDLVKLVQPFIDDVGELLPDLVIMAKDLGTKVPPLIDEAVKLFQETTASATPGVLSAWDRALKFQVKVELEFDKITKFIDKHSGNASNVIDTASSFADRLNNLGGAIRMVGSVLHGQN